MRALVIIEPIAVNSSFLGKVFSFLEVEQAKIIGIKLELLDIQNLKKQLRSEKNPKTRTLIKEKLKVPCVLIAIEALKAIEICKRVEQTFPGAVHVSKNAEIAKYELKRFFKENEIFMYEKVMGWDEEK